MGSSKHKKIRVQFDFHGQSSRGRRDTPGRSRVVTVVPEKKVGKKGGHDHLRVRTSLHFRGPGVPCRREEKQQRQLLIILHAEWADGPDSSDTNVKDVKNVKPVKNVKIVKDVKDVKDHILLIFHILHILRIFHTFLYTTPAAANGLP